MNSLLELVREEKIEEKPASLKKLLESHHARELFLGALLASHEMLTEYIKSPVWISALGAIDEINGVIKDSSGSYRIPTKLGFLQKPTNNPPEAMGEYEADVLLSAVQCIGTEDPGGSDEVYGFVTLYSLIPGKQEAVGPPVKLPLTENVTKGGVIFKNTAIGTVPLISGTNGFNIHMQLWDEELLGSPDEAGEKLVKAIESFLLALTGGAAVAAGTVPGAQVPAAALAASAGLAFFLLQQKDIRELLKPIFAELAKSLQDDLIGEKTFTVTPKNILDWSTTPGMNASEIVRPELGADTSFNIPTDIDNPIWLFNEGGATYKAFFRVKTRHVDPFPIPKV